MKDDDWGVLEAMTTYGGSFVQALAEAARRADPTNYARLRHAFPDVWAEYREKAAWPRRTRRASAPTDEAG